MPTADAFCLIYRWEHIQSRQSTFLSSSTVGKKMSVVPLQRHTVPLVQCKFSLAWRDRQIDGRWVHPIKMGGLQHHTDSYTMSSGLISRIRIGELPRDKKPNCSQIPRLISELSIGICFISDSVKSKGRETGTGPQS